VELWFVTHRPKTLDQYVWADAEMRRIVEGWLDHRALPHCLFSGHHGTGKTSLAFLLLDLLGVPQADRMYVNASRVRKVDELHDRMINFVSAWASPENDTDIKYIFLDEADRMSPTAQGMLRAEMENYPDTRFILTCNEARKIIPPLHSRLQEIKFATLNKGQFIERAADVLDAEHIRYDVETLMQYVTPLYPDLRKCIGTLQQNSRNGVLASPSTQLEGTADYLPKVFSLFKAGHYGEARRLFIERADPDNYPDVMRQVYLNFDALGIPPALQDRALVAVRDALVNHTLVADPEINMAALFAELCIIITR
jgi:DNA polymerase III delta prime subunit